jgi:hypothetical protein
MSVHIYYMHYALVEKMAPPFLEQNTSEELVPKCQKFM